MLQQSGKIRTATASKLGTASRRSARKLPGTISMINTRVRVESYCLNENFRLEDTVFRRNQDSIVNEAPTEETHAPEHEEDLDDDSCIEAGSSKKMKEVAWLDEEDIALT
jgi:hypothetical protein